MMMVLLLVLSIVTAQYYQPSYGTMFNLVQENTLCKNRGRVNQGELSVPETIVVDNPAGTVQACADAVRNTGGMCSDVFFSNAKQCACLRPGSECKEETSETGFSVYRLALLAKPAADLSKMCATLSEDKCADHQSCHWAEGACSQIVLSSSGVVGHTLYASPGPIMSNSPNSHPMQPMTNAYPNAANGHSMPPGPNGYAGVQMIRKDAECDREIDEVTGESNIQNLANSITLAECQAQVQDLFNRGVCTSYFVYQEMDGFPSECTCVRAGGKYSLCDVDDHRPGYTVFQLTSAGMNSYPGAKPNQPYPQGGAQQYPPTNPAGAYPAGPVVPPNGAYNPGYGPQANMHGTGPYNGMPQNGYQQGPGYAAPMNGYQNGVAYGANPQAYPGQRIGHQFLSKSQPSETSESKPNSIVMVVAILSSSFAFGVVVAMCYYFWVQRRNNKLSPILLEENNTKV